MEAFYRSTRLPNAGEAAPGRDGGGEPTSRRMREEKAAASRTAANFLPPVATKSTRPLRRTNGCSPSCSRETSAAAGTEHVLREESQGTI